VIVDIRVSYLSAFAELYEFLFERRLDAGAV
jgi:hypothetical protein